MSARPNSTELIEAALDQPSPTPELTDALNRVLERLKHPDRLLKRGGR